MSNLEDDLQRNSNNFQANEEKNSSSSPIVESNIQNSSESALLKSDDRFYLNSIQKIEIIQRRIDHGDSNEKLLLKRERNSGMCWRQINFPITLVIYTTKEREEEENRRRNEKRKKGEKEEKEE